MSCVIGRVRVRQPLVEKGGLGGQGGWATNMTVFASSLPSVVGAADNIHAAQWRAGFHLLLLKSFYRCQVRMKGLK